MNKRYPERAIGSRHPLLLGTRRPSGAAPDSTLTGDIRQHVIESEIVGTRRFLVYLPPGYSDSDPWRYPVLYLNDGQNVFDRTTAAFGVEWSVDEVAEDLIRAGEIPGIMMVAVYNSPDRVQEYTPSEDPVYGGGDGWKYRQFLIQELKPTVDRLYPTSHRAVQTAIAGSSLGGLCALYIGWTSPKTFGAVGALSPSLWWAGRDLITSIAGDTTPLRPARVWVDMGTEESAEDRNRNDVPDVIDDVRTLRAVLLSKGYVENRDLAYREVVGATHDEESWSRRIADVLRFLFPPDADGG